MCPPSPSMFFLIVRYNFIPGLTFQRNSPAFLAIKLNNGGNQPYLLYNSLLKNILLLHRLILTKQWNKVYHLLLYVMVQIKRNSLMVLMSYNLNVMPLLWKFHSNIMASLTVKIRSSFVLYLKDEFLYLCRVLGLGLLLKTEDKIFLIIWILFLYKLFN